MSDDLNHQLSQLLDKTGQINVAGNLREKAADLFPKIILEYELAKTDESDEATGETPPNIESIDEIIDSVNPKNKIKLQQLFNKIPEQKLAFHFVNCLFVQLVNDDNLPYLIRLLISQLYLPVLRLTFKQPGIIKDSQNSALRIISEVLDYTPIWKDEATIGFPTYNKLSIILYFQNTQNEHLLDQVTSALESIIQLKLNQRKRTLIFEKRLKEKERSQNKIAIANKIVDGIFIDLFENQAILEISPLPNCIQNIIDLIWKKLLFLEYVRDDIKVFHYTLNILRDLLISILPISHQEALDWLFEKLPKINSAIKKASSKTSCDQVVSSSILNELEAIHIQLISESKKSIKEAKTNGSYRASGEAEEILRLPPSDVFGMGVQSSTQNPTVKKESPIAEKLDSKFSIEVMFLEFTVSSNDLSKKYCSVINKKETSKTTSILKKYAVHDEQWFWFESENTQSLNKLLLVIKETSDYIFVDQSGQKSHTLGQNTFFDCLENTTIKPFESNQYFEFAIKSILNQSASFINKADKNTTPIQTKNPNADKRKNQNKNIKASVRKRTRALGIDDLSVGSWVKISRNKTKFACKLAAKIASKNAYIFVDRQGKKLLELTYDQLTAIHASGKLEWVNVEVSNDKLLESVISNTRSMKSENQ